MRVVLALLVLLLVAGIGAGAAWLVLREDEPGRATTSVDGPTTNAAEAGTVSDLAESVADEYSAALSMTKHCDRNRDLYADTAGEGYRVCFEQEVKPILDSADDVALDSIEELEREVGPECLRALRRSELSFGDNDLELPGDSLKRTARVCRDEAA